MLSVIMSGGCGERLWPMSRANMPKQFNDFLGKSLLQMTIDRLSQLDNKPIVISIESQKYFIKNNFKNSVTSLIEPLPKNTAPAIALLCRYLEINQIRDEVVGVFPADHYISNEKTFQIAISEANAQAAKGSIVTLGIKPSYPATGFGYIELNGSEDLKPSKVISFKEKPEKIKAEEYINKENYFWNAGIFVFQVSKMIESFQKLQPKMWSLFQELKSDFSNVEDVYNKVESISIDYAIMEQDENIFCIPCDMGWMDLGSWDSISDLEKSNMVDLKGNKSILRSLNAKNNFSYSDKGKTHCLVDVENLIIVDTSDALLIAKKGSSQKVKNVVAEIKSEQNNDILKHTTEHRPWGKFELLAKEESFQFKKIVIMPGERLSYQSHAKRAEHWVIIKGAARVTLNENTSDLKAGDHVFVQIGDKHRIENIGKDQLIFVEVQTGSAFCENDIVRYSDDYGRDLS